MTNGSTHWTFYLSGSMSSNCLNALFCRQCLEMALPLGWSPAGTSYSLPSADWWCLHLGFELQEPLAFSTNIARSLSALLPRKPKFGDISIWIFLYTLWSQTMSDFFPKELSVLTPLHVKVVRTIIYSYFWPPGRTISEGSGSVIGCQEENSLLQLPLQRYI